MRKLWIRRVVALASLFASTTLAENSHAQAEPPSDTEEPPTPAQPAPAPPPPDDSATSTFEASTTPPPGDEDTDDEPMVFTASRPTDMQRLAEDSMKEVSIGAVRPRYAVNLFGDISFGASSRSEGSSRRPEPSFGLGVFDMLFSGSLDNKLIATTEVSFAYSASSPSAILERMHVRWRPTNGFFIEAGRLHTDLGYWNVAYHHGRWLQLTVDRPRTIALHGGLLPVHWLGIQSGVSLPLAGGTVSLIGTVGSAHDPIGSAHASHGGSADYSPVNGVHGKLEFADIGLRELRFGVAGVYDRIGAETRFNRPALPDQSIDEYVGNAFIAFPSVPFMLISEAYIIQHQTNGSALPENAGSKWRTFGAFALLGYQIGAFTPYIRGEYIGSEVGAYMFNPFYVPEHNPIGGFAVPMDLQEGVVGTRIDLSTWCSVKLEYQVTAGIANRRWDLATPIIHSGLANWSFGL